MKPIKPAKSSKLKNDQKPGKKFPVMYIVAAVAAAVVIVAVISLLTGGVSGTGAGVVDETEAQARWKDSTGPTQKKK